LFGLLAVELAVSLTDQGRHTLVLTLAAVFFLASTFFAHRSFYGMRIKTSLADDEAEAAERGSPGVGRDAAPTVAVDKASELADSGVGEGR